MAANLADEAQSWVLQSDGAYIRAQAPDGVEPFNVHDFFMENPSLSGRGARGTADAPRLRPDTPSSDSDDESGLSAAPEEKLQSADDAQSGADEAEPNSDEKPRKGGGKLRKHGPRDGKGSAAPQQPIV